MSVTLTTVPVVKVNKCVSMFQIITASFQGIRKRPPKNERFVNVLLIKLCFVYIYKLEFENLNFISGKLNDYLADIDEQA